MVGENEGDSLGGGERRLPGLLYANGLVLHGESERNLRLMIEHFEE